MNYTPSEDENGNPIGWISLDDYDYYVVQKEDDFAEIHVDGDLLTGFFSSNTDGFEDFDDVLNQAWDLLYDQGLAITDWDSDLD